MPRSVAEPPKIKSTPMAPSTGGRPMVVPAAEVDIVAALDKPPVDA
jgi:hypothetical protein